MPGFCKAARFLPCVFFSAALSQAALASERSIRVGIVPKADRFVFTVEGRYETADSLGRPRALAGGKTYALKASERLLSMGNLSLPAETVFFPQDAGSALWIADRRYPGIFRVRLNSDKTVTAVEELGIESYLLGVIGNEMEASWPLEALKAQAVVARTFAYAQLEKRHPEGYQIRDDAGSQVYGGIGYIPASVARAVAQTRGEVLGYQGKLLDVYYHSCCGGHTADAAWVWGSKTPAPEPLRGVKDPYCRLSPVYRWKAFFSYDEIAAAFQTRRIFGGALRAFGLGPARDGYVKSFTAAIGDRELQESANEFRLAIGPSALKSARIVSIKQERGGIEFSGMGSGHGVGLCQWGAKAQADRGRRYEDILRFYFPGSVLSVVR